MQHLYPRLLCQHSTWLKHQTVNQPEPKYILTEYLTRILDVSCTRPRFYSAAFNGKLPFQMRFSYQFRHRAWRMVMQPYPHILASNLTQELVSSNETSDECVPLCPSVLLDFLSNLKLTIVFCVFAVNSIWRCICQSYFSFIYDCALANIHDLCHNMETYVANLNIIL